MEDSQAKPKQHSVLYISSARDYQKSNTTLRIFFPLLQTPFGLVSCLGGAWQRESDGLSIKLFPVFFFAFGEVVNG